MVNQQDADRRSLDLHALIAQRIREDPSLLGRVVATIARWRTNGSRANCPYLDRWESLIHEGLEACLSMAIEESARGDVMRQASPFAGILSPTERLDFLKSWTPEWSKLNRTGRTASQPLVDSMTQSGEFKRAPEDQEGFGESLAPGEGASGNPGNPGRRRSS